MIAVAFGRPRTAAVPLQVGLPVRCGASQCHPPFAQRLPHVWSLASAFLSTKQPFARPLHALLLNLLFCPAAWTLRRWNSAVVSAVAFVKLPALAVIVSVLPCSWPVQLP